MARRAHREREYHRPPRARDAPLERHERRRADHHARDDHGAHEEREPEALEDLRHLLEEVRALDLLLRRAPSDVVREEVGEERLRKMDAQAAEEEEAVTRRERERAVLLVQA